MTAELPGLGADTLDEFALAAAARTPGHPAVAGVGPDLVTYAELRQLTEDYAKVLDGLGVQVGDRIVVDAHACAYAIAMLLACSRVGATFIPVTPDLPDGRLAAIIASTGPVLVAAAAAAPPRDLTVATARFGPDGIDAAAAGRANAGPRRRRGVTATDAAYIIFTSGSTGRPKGVVMSHRAALAFYRGALRFGLVTPADRVASTAPLSFDVSLFDIGVTLGAGATLVPVPRELLCFPRRLCGFLRDSQATSMHAVPSVFRPLLRFERESLAALGGSGGSGGPRNLRSIMITGEDFPLPEVRDLQELMPGLRIVNAFGATETVAFSFAEVPRPLPADAQRLPIGNGYPGGEMSLLDEQGRPVDQDGEIGEIYVRGPSAFNGYWDDPDATRKVLVPDPLNPRSGQLVYRSGDLAYRGADGDLYFCGRADSMVKIRGNRIEPGEIERCLRGHPAIAEAAVLAISAPDGDLSLAAFAVLKPAYPADAEELIGWCKRDLPSYMIPRRVLILAELPLSPAGKIDRQALTALAADSPASCGQPTP
jgi:amino acid adenylation domain-containing protein